MPITDSKLGGNAMPSVRTASSDAPSSEPGSVPQAKRSSLSLQHRLLFLVLGWLLVLTPFLFWWNTWFGRSLTSKQMDEYLKDDAHPRHIQHAIIQIGERMSQRDPSVTRWYGDLLRLSAYPREEVRSTDAWVMGQDTGVPGFHEALTRMLQDPSMLVRGNAALSLVRFGDASGRDQILSLLRPVVITTSIAGRIVDASPAGTSIHQGGLVAKLETSNSQIQELRSPIAGRVQVASAAGTTVEAGTSVATVDPDEDQVWEALRALYLIGRFEDLPVIRPYERNSTEFSEKLRQQAIDTDRAIQERGSH